MDRMIYLVLWNVEVLCGWVGGTFPACISDGRWSLPDWRVVAAALQTTLWRAVVRICLTFKISIAPKFEEVISVQRNNEGHQLNSKEPSSGWKQAESHDAPHPWGTWTIGRCQVWWQTASHQSASIQVCPSGWQCRWIQWQSGMDLVRVCPHSLQVKRARWHFLLQGGTK